MFDRLACLTPEGHQPHALHAAERIWPETNCYVDLWIEVLSALGLEPKAMLGFTLSQDFEGDQFTFFKVPLEDLEKLHGIRATELAVYEPVETHVETQIARGRLCLVEVDSYFLPDTNGVSYRLEPRQDDRGHHRARHRRTQAVLLPQRRVLLPFGRRFRWRVPARGPRAAASLPALHGVREISANPSAGGLA